MVQLELMPIGERYEARGQFADAILIDRSRYPGACPPLPDRQSATPDAEFGSKPEGEGAVTLVTQCEEF